MLPASSETDTPSVKIGESQGDKAGNHNEVAIGEEDRMSILNDIAGWLKDQPVWLSDMTRRVFEKGQLEGNDLLDVAAFVKAASGIPDTKDRVPVVLNPDDLPVPPTVAAVYLTAITDPQNVNAIDHPQGVTFEPDGLTVVYGYNGAGKSGYARLLKKACRARNKEDVLPNVFLAAPAAGKPQARFHWVMGGAAADGVWNDGVAAPEALSAVAVFDSYCARVFVDAQSEVSFVPYGLDILREVATGLSKVQELISAEAVATKFDTNIFNHLRGPTEVGKAIAALGPTSTPEALRALSGLTEEATMRHKTLATSLKEDPAVQAIGLRRTSARLRSLKNELDALASPLVDENIGNFRLAMAEYVTATAASKLASEELTEGGNALKGTGTDPWRELLESAMRFAADEPYPGEPFPSEQHDARCVLCQQPLNDVARSRLQRFVAFLAEDTQQRVNEKRKIAGVFNRGIENLQPDLFPADKTLLEELVELDDPLLEVLVSYKAALDDRRRTVLQMAKEREIGELVPLPLPPAELFEIRLAAIEKSAQEFDSSVVPDIRAQRSAEYTELEARLQLEKVLPNVLTCIDAMKLGAALRTAERACNTTAVTRKNGELYEKAVTADLRAALHRELKTMGMTGLNVALDTQGQRGNRVQQLKLDVPRSIGKTKLSQILSEGEQSAIAIAAFLAEVGLEPHKSAIVLDDPVSSLDHMKRERIAQRLAEEARHRQVIVFTHDLAFAWSLKEKAGQAGSKVATRHVYSAMAAKGKVSDALPFEGLDVGKRIKQLQDQAKAAREVLGKGDVVRYDELVRGGYRKLRDSWELLVEDKLFGQVVKRFRNSVATLRLRSVEVTDADVKAIYDGLTRCSSFVHEGALEAPLPLPTPDEFDEDIERLNAMLTSLNGRKGDLEARRIKLGIPAL